MKKAFQLLATIEDWTMILALSYMVTITFIEVLMRYLAKNPVTWAEESARYAQVWLIYISAGVCVRLRNHISADILMPILPPSACKVLLRIASLFTFCVLLVLFYLGLALVKNFLKGGQLSPAIGIPMYFVAIAIPVGIGLSILRYLGILLTGGNQLPPSAKE